MNSTWEIEDLKYNTSDGRVTHLLWKLTSTHGDVTEVRRGSTPLSGDAVVPFALVTRAMALTWLESNISTEVKDALQAKLEAHVNVKLAGETAVGTPNNW